MVTFVDTALGEFVETLKAKSMWENTLMVVLSDNGGPIYPGKAAKLYGGANNYPLRGGKASDWEGGVRTAAFVAGGVLPPKVRGTTLEDYIHVADWYATFAAAAGIADVHDDVAATHKLPQVDSINQWPLISGLVEPGSKLRKDIHLSSQALIDGQWKVITGKLMFDDIAPGYGMRPWITLLKRRNCKAGCLFDIVNDPSEKNDLAAKRPDILSKMTSKLSELNKGLFNPNRGEVDAKSMEACNMLQRGGYYTAFADDLMNVTSTRSRDVALMV
jgi:arylsulfatase I/J